MNTDRQALGEDLDLSLAGERLTQIRLDYTLTLVFGNGGMIQFATPIQVTADGSVISFNPEEPETSTLGLLRKLLDNSVQYAVAIEDGTLTLRFAESHVELISHPSADYEAWTFTNAQGCLIVALPGGGRSLFASSR